ncbi:aspartate-semialdehyde dehydrogenase [Oscillospiraceae bacterium OttesenSCG-928-G22]|nr:aspartate-semialdehyde dehydrogenase [Oscillospiraceae bacterium OttesenSCG-928-G22]
MERLTIGVVGATGAVGTQMLKVLETSNLSIEKVIPYGTSRLPGRTVPFRGESLEVKTAEKGAFRGVDIALFSAGADASKELAPVAVAEGALVIDNSSAYRMDDEVPLIIPEVNPDAAKGHRGIIANPNCSTAQMLVALKPLHDAFTITRVVVSTYQAVSGTGLPAVDELKNQVAQFVTGEAMTNDVYPHQIAFNCLPHIDDFLDSGFTKEEMKMANETHKMLDPAIAVVATAVRVPVFRGHSEAIFIETARELPPVPEILELLRRAPGLVVRDDPKNGVYPMPIDCEATGDTFVGRFRKDPTVKNGLCFWCVSDNLYKGAAYNAVQIAELVAEKDWIQHA